MNISNNAAVDSSTTAFAWNYWNPSTFGPDSEAYATIATFGASDVIRIGARVTGAGTTTTPATSSPSAQPASGRSCASTTAPPPPSPPAPPNHSPPATKSPSASSAPPSPPSTTRPPTTGPKSSPTTPPTTPPATPTPATSPLEFKTSTIDNFGGGTLATAPSPPAIQTSPSISGTATVGQTLTLNQGTWTGTPTPTLTPQWKRLRHHRQQLHRHHRRNLHHLHPHQAADVGSTIDATVTATNTAGTTAATTTPTATVTAASSLAPTTPLLDTFDRANGAAGSNWSLIKPTGFAAMTITNNAAVDSSTTAFAWNYWNPSTYGPDSEAYATIATLGASDVIRIGARVTGGGTTTYSGYFVAISATGVWSILRIDNGATTTLATGPTQPLATGDQIAIRITGTTITALHYTPTTNWTQVLTYNTNNDTTRYTNPGNLAIEFKTSTIDNFGGGGL